MVAFNRRRVGGVGIAVLLAAGAAPAEAGVITSTGDVSPAGLGPGDTTTSGIVAVGSTGTGTLSVTGGATLTAGSLQLGTPQGVPLGTGTGGNGAVNIDGSGSTINSPGTLLGFGGNSTSTLSITNGASLVDSGQGGVGMTVANNPTATANITVSGAGSNISITDTGGATLAGPGFTIGKLGTASLTIANGGKVSVDTGPATLGGVAIGGAANLTGSPSKGSITVTGAGSALTMKGAVDGMSVGASGSGTLTVDQGASVNMITGINIGRNVGSDGTVTVSNGATLGITNQPNGVGGAINVGAASTGKLNVFGGTVTIDGAGATPAPSVALNVGGSSTISGGTGQATVDGAGSLIQVQNAAQNVINVGRQGTGTLSIDNGAQVTVGDATAGHTGNVRIGVNATRTGSVSVDGTDSLLNATTGLSIGLAADDLTDAGTGSLNVSNGATVQAPSVRIGTNGTLGGNGTVIGTVTNAGGVVSPGNSPGTLTINGGLHFLRGTLKIQIAGKTSGKFDLLKILGAANFTGGTIDVDFVDGFAPTTGDSFDFLESNQLTASGFGLKFEDVDPNFRFALATGNTDLVLDTLSGLAPVPEPTTLALLLAGVSGLAVIRRRQAKR